MKKIILTLLILIIGTSVFAKPNYTYTTSDTPASAYSGTYVNEEITTPITKIGIPEEYLETQVEEQGLEIVWNQWHADVRNLVYNKLQKYDKFPSSQYLCEYIYTVDKNKSISNIVIVYIPGTAILPTKIIDPHSEFYMYVDSTKKYYRLKQYTMLPVNASRIRLILQSVLKSNAIVEEEMYKVPYAVLFEPMAEVIRKCEQNKVLTFPEKSKRTSVVVTQGITNIKRIQDDDSEYKASEFNDTERW